MSVPRDKLLGLADTINAMDDAANCDAAAYLNAVNALIRAAREMTQYIKGDD